MLSPAALHAFPALEGTQRNAGMLQQKQMLTPIKMDEQKRRQNHFKLWRQESKLATLKGISSQLHGEGQDVHGCALQNGRANGKRSSVSFLQVQPHK